MSRPQEPRQWPKPAWATGQLLRETGILEDTCVHGIGHPNEAFIKAKGLDDVYRSHGCDGCCEPDNV